MDLIPLQNRHNIAAFLLHPLWSTWQCRGDNEKDRNLMWTHLGVIKKRSSSAIWPEKHTLLKGRNSCLKGISFRVREVTNVRRMAYSTSIPYTMGLREMIQLIWSNSILWLRWRRESPVTILTPAVCVASALGSSEHFMSQLNHSTQHKTSPSKTEMDLLSSGLVSWVSPE